MILNNEIEILIISSNLKYYKSKGYKCSVGDNIKILASDLPKGSHVRVSSKCNCCGLEKEIIYKDYYRSISKYGKYDCSVKCRNKKDHKKCLFCNIEKSTSEFNQKANTCDDCTRKKSLDYYHKNKNIDIFKDKRSEYNKVYRINNSENIKRYKSEWFKNNKRKTNYYQSKKECILFKLMSRIRCLIGSSIRRQGYDKKMKTKEILGVDFLEFKIYIESQFKEGMSWENHGEWHLDHKIPISWAKSEEDVYKLNHYTNFQPLWKLENLSKGNRFST